MSTRKTKSSTSAATQARKGGNTKGFPSAGAAIAEPLAIVKDDRGHSALKLRSRLGMNRETFARLVPISVRNLANIESGNEPTENVLRRLKELRRVVNALSEVMQKDAIGPWVNQPNDAFDGLKPIEVIERGEVDRIWQVIFFLRSGVAF